MPNRAIAIPSKRIRFEMQLKRVGRFETCPLPQPLESIAHGEHFHSVTAGVGIFRYLFAHIICEIRINFRNSFEVSHLQISS